MLLRRHPDHVVVVDTGHRSAERPAVGFGFDLHQAGAAAGYGLRVPAGRRRQEDEAGWFDGRKAFGRLVGEWLYFLPDEYRRLRDNLGGETVKGLEIAARLYGLEQLEERLALPFARELLERDQAAALRLRDQAGRTDFPFLLSQPAELQLQVIRRQADEGHLRFRPLAQRLFPDTLRAADALAACGGIWKGRISLKEEKTPNNASGRGHACPANGRNAPASETAGHAGPITKEKSTRPPATACLNSPGHKKSRPSISEKGGFLFYSSSSCRYFSRVARPPRICRCALLMSSTLRTRT